MDGAAGGGFAADAVSPGGSGAGSVSQALVHSAAAHRRPDSCLTVTVGAHAAGVASSDSHEGATWARGPGSETQCVGAGIPSRGTQ